MKTDVFFSVSEVKITKSVAFRKLDFNIFYVPSLFIPLREKTDICQIALSLFLIVCSSLSLCAILSMCVVFPKGLFFSKNIRYFFFMQNVYLVREFI